MMSLPTIISCFIKIQNSSAAFLVPAYPGCRVVSSEVLTYSQPKSTYSLTTFRPQVCLMSLSGMLILVVKIMCRIYLMKLLTELSVSVWLSAALAMCVCLCQAGISVITEHCR